MRSIPADALKAVPADARRAVDNWWISLSDVEREKTASLWDRRRESCFFERQTSEDGTRDSWNRVPAVTGGRFVPHDDSIRMHEWLEDRMEYVLGQDDFLLGQVLVFRTFHICQAEPAARAVTESGVLPLDYVCPLNLSECPMRRLQSLAPGKSIHLSPAAAGGWWVVIDVAKC
jgi:hypothetical protein